MDARGANTFPSHNQLPNLNQGFHDIFLSPHGINKRRWRLHCMKNGSDFPARYSYDEDDDDDEDWEEGKTTLRGLV